MKKNTIMFKLVDETLNGGWSDEKLFATLKGANGEANNRHDCMSRKEAKKHHIYVMPVQWSTETDEIKGMYNEEVGGFWEELPCDSEYNRYLIVGCYNDFDPLIDIDHYDDGLHISVRESVKVYVPNNWIEECRNDEMQDFEIIDDIIDDIADEMRRKDLYLFEYEVEALKEKLAFEIDYV